MNVLGIDPGTGLDNFGWGIVTPQGYIDSGIFRINPKLQFRKKLSFIGEFVIKLIGDYNITLMSVETFFAFGRSKGGQRIHELRGVLQYISSIENIDYIDVAPTSVKKLVGNSGTSSKAKVAKAVASRLKIDVKNKSSHETDALAIALAGPYVKLQKEQS